MRIKTTGLLNASTYALKEYTIWQAFSIRNTNTHISNCEQMRQNCSRYATPTWNRCCDKRPPSEFSLRLGGVVLSTPETTFSSTFSSCSLTTNEQH